MHLLNLSWLDCWRNFILSKYTRHVSRSNIDKCNCSNSYSWIYQYWKQLQCVVVLLKKTLNAYFRDHVLSVRPFRRHLFRCQSFSAQIVSAPIRCSLTVQLFRVRVWVRASQKAPNIGAEKVRAGMVAPQSRGPFLSRWIQMLWWPSLTKDLQTGPKKGGLALVWLNRRRMLVSYASRNCIRVKLNFISVRWWVSKILLSAYWPNSENGGAECGAHQASRTTENWIRKGKMQ